MKLLTIIKSLETLQKEKPGLVWLALWKYYGSLQCHLKSLRISLTFGDFLTTVSEKFFESRLWENPAIVSVWDELTRQQIIVLDFYHPQFPARLKASKYCPPLLTARGNLHCLELSALGIVGTRKPSPLAPMTCQKLITPLRPLGIMIVSGLAYGIDMYCHEQALLTHLPTCAVLGQGLLVPLFDRQKLMTEKILRQNGVMVSQFWPEFAASVFTYPQRNRIISALSDGVCLVESGRKGGGMITAELAYKEQKPVFACPGSLLSAYSSGPNQLIAQGKARILENAQQLVQFFREPQLPLLPALPSHFTSEGSTGKSRQRKPN